MDPSFRQLEYVVAIAEAGSFSRAADRCFVTQPALSAQIAQLEKTLGVRLFDRGRCIQATAAGESVILQARKILADVRNLAESARNFSEPMAGRVRLGTIPTVSPYLLPRLFSGLRLLYPHMRLTLREAQTRELIHALHAGDLDLLLIALDVEMGPVEEEVLLQDRFFLLAPSSHQLAGGDQVQESDLDSQRVLLLDDGHCLRSHAIAACNLRRSPDSDDFSAASLSTLVRLVEAGVGLTLLPEMAIAAEVRPSASTRLIPFREPAPHRRIGMVWRRGSARSRDFRLLVQASRAILGRSEAEESFLPRAAVV